MEIEGYNRVIIPISNIYKMKMSSKNVQVLLEIIVYNIGM